MSGSERAADGVVEPVGSDVDPHRPKKRWDLRRQGLSVVAVIAAGGALGASARYGVALALPHRPSDWPWSTLLVNVTGCLLIGVLMVLVLEVWVAHRLVRPFLGVGLLGGYTTFSTYAVEAQQLIAAGRAGPALAYMVVTVVAALIAVQVGITGTRMVALRTAKERGGER